jgi:hypothetical protein
MYANLVCLIIVATLGIQMQAVAAPAQNPTDGVTDSKPFDATAYLARYNDKEARGRSTQHFYDLMMSEDRDISDKVADLIKESGGLTVSEKIDCKKMGDYIKELTGFNSDRCKNHLKIISFSALTNGSNPLTWERFKNSINQSKIKWHEIADRTFTVHDIGPLTRYRRETGSDIVAILEFGFVFERIEILSFD